MPGVQLVILSDVVEPVLKEVTAQYGVPNYTLTGDEVCLYIYIYVCVYVLVDGWVWIFLHFLFINKNTTN